MLRAKLFYLLASIPKYPIIGALTLSKMDASESTVWWGKREGRKREKEGRERKTPMCLTVLGCSAQHLPPSRMRDIEEQVDDKCPGSFTASTDTDSPSPFTACLFHRIECVVCWVRLKDSARPESPAFSSSQAKLIPAPLFTFRFTAPFPSSFPFHLIALFVSLSLLLSLSLH